MWDIISSALKWTGFIILVLYYFFPTTVGIHLNLIICIYILLWFFYFIGYYFFNTPTNANIEGLWVMTPKNINKSESYDKNSQIMIKKKGMINLLSERDTKSFLKESFTFGFFLSVDKSSIEMIDGSSLKTDLKPYQLIVDIPGVFSVYVDPFHEMLMIDFFSFNASKYTINMPTLKNQRWNQILVTIEGRNADIYQNGVLIKSVLLQNIISNHPGTPLINMNPDMFARIAFVQSWPSRLTDTEINNNYRANTDKQGVPFIPTPVVILPGFPELSLSGINLCFAGFCFESIQNQADALTYVNYMYA
jgi:hypothetical protein